MLKLTSHKTFHEVKHFPFNGVNTFCVSYLLESAGVLGIKKQIWVRVI